VTVTDVEEQPWGRYEVLDYPDGNGLILTQMTHPEEVKSR
jgi:hypothetical protein